MSQALEPKEFVERIEGHLRELEELLERLGDEVQEGELVTLTETVKDLRKDVFRTPLETLTTMVSDLHNIANGVKEDPSALDETTLDLFQDSCEKIQEIVDKASKKEDWIDDSTLSVLNEKLDLFTFEDNPDFEPPSRGEVSEDEEETESVESEMTTDNLRFEPWDPDDVGGMINDYLAESREQLEALTNSLIELEEDPSDDVIDRIFRVAHTLKGSSGMVGFTALEELAHDIEELLDDVREGSLEVTPELIDLLLMCNDKIEELLDRVEQLEVVEVPVGHFIDAVNEFREDGSADIEKLKEQEEQQTSDGDDDEDDAKDDDSSSETSIEENIRVSISKLDKVINLVGELVINKGQLDQTIKELLDLGDELGTLREDDENNSAFRAGKSTDIEEELTLIWRSFQELSLDVNQAVEELDRVMGELQEKVMRTRMVPVAQEFNKFPRLVRDISRETGKEVDLTIEGQDTEMDKTVIEQISDPLMHLIRNSVDHGIELPEEREKQGKNPEGSLRVWAEYEGNMVVIGIEDDGAGIDPEGVGASALEKGVVTEDELDSMSEDEIQELIFAPGFSTKEEVTETSGRGVGMDVVKSNIMELNGSIEMDSTVGEGTTMEIKLPLTLAIIEVVMVRVQDERFALPLSSVKETLKMPRDKVEQLGQQEVIELRNESLSVLRLSDVLGMSRGRVDNDLASIVVVQSGNETIGLMVDDLIDKREIVIKDLGDILDDIRFCSGATVMGDGSVVLIVDLGQVVQNADQLASQSESSSQLPSSSSSKDSESGGERILTAEDSETTRRMIVETFETEGFDVTGVENGKKALKKAQEESFDLVLTDIQMPEMNGYDLTEELRDRSDYQSTPIIMVSSLDETIDQMRGFEAGADDYLEKPFSEDELLQITEELLDSMVR